MIKKTQQKTKNYKKIRLPLTNNQAENRDILFKFLTKIYKKYCKVYPDIKSLNITLNNRYGNAISYVRMEGAYINFTISSEDIPKIINLHIHVQYYRQETPEEFHQRMEAARKRKLEKESKERKKVHAAVSKLSVEQQKRILKEIQAGLIIAEKK